MRYKVEDQIAIYCLQLRPPIRTDPVKKQEAGYHDDREEDEDDEENDDSDDNDGKAKLRLVKRGPGIRSGILAASSFAAMKQEGARGNAGKSRYRPGCLLLLIVPAVCPRVLNLS